MVFSHLVLVGQFFRQQLLFSRYTKKHERKGEE
jgi:hypothetical protein